MNAPAAASPVPDSSAERLDSIVQESSPSGRGGAGVVVPAHEALGRQIEASPRMAAQRRQMAQAFGPAAPAAAPMPAGLPVQAKMGFELETDNRADKWVGNRWVPYGRRKGYPMYVCEGYFAVETDTHNNPEFIFDPQDDKGEITTAAEKAATFTDQLNATYAAKKDAFDEKDHDNSFQDNADEGWQGDFRIKVDDPTWAADGQVTMGVKLEDIPSYIEHVLPRAKGAAFKTMREKKGVADAGRSADVDGLLALMIQFVADFKTWQGRQNEEGPKNAQAYMNRNSFDKMAKSMGEDEQAEFKALFYHGDGRWKDANPLTAATGVGKDTRVIPNNFSDSDGRAVIELTTLKQWVDSIFASVALKEDDYETDLMSPPSPAWRGGNYGMGLLDMDTDSVADTPLALFEYRQTDNREEMGETSGKALSVDNWATWMEERFDNAQAWNDTLKDPDAVADDDDNGGEGDQAAVDGAEGGDLAAAAGGGAVGEAGEVEGGAEGAAVADAGAAQLRAQDAGGEPTSPVASAASVSGGLPAALKTGIENLSGIAMDDVKVHYNSGQPAQMRALAYAQGSDIHVAPGQEKHLPHEAWHVVQQKQGRVRPTTQLKDTPVNDDAGLEAEADAMGASALRQTAGAQPAQARAAAASQPAQRMVGFEIDVESHAFAKAEAKEILKGGGGDWDFKQDLLKLAGYGITLQFDAGTLELIMPPVDEPGGTGHLEHLFQGVGIVFEVLARVEDSIDFIHEDDQETPQVKIVYPADEPFRRDREDKDKEDKSGDGSKLSAQTLRRVSRAAPVFGDLQATVGAKFSAIGTLADVLTGTEYLRSDSVDEKYGAHSWDPKEKYGNKDQRSYVAAASARVLSWVASNTELAYEEAEEIMGFLTILATYLISSAEAQRLGVRLQDAKGIAPLMSRVSLGAVWKQLAADKYAWVTPEAVLAMAGVADGLLFGEAVDPERYTHPPEAERYRQEDKQYGEMTRTDWLAGIIDGKRDLLSGLGDSISEVEPDEDKQEGTENRTTTDFRMANAVDIGHGRKGMVLELRRLPRHLDFRGLKQLAEKIYYLVEAGNRLSQ